IRRWIIENDWLEAIIALPNNMFYNTDIATYIWVVTNRKPEHRRGKVQLIDATNRSTPRRKNLGAKNVDLSDADRQAIVDEYLAFEETETSKIFPNEAFGYWKVTVDRPLRLRVDIPDRDDPAGTDLVSVRSSDAGQLANPAAWAALPEPVREAILAIPGDPGKRAFDDYAEFETAFVSAAKRRGVKITAKLKKDVREAVAVRDETAKPIVRKQTSDTVEYEPDPELRDTEQIPLTEPGGIA